MAKRPNTNFNNKNNLNKNKKRVNKVGNKQSNGIQKKRPPVKTNKVVQDARNKLIQKKRSQVVDARDVLAQIAKKHDARDKLNKIRERRNGNKTTITLNNKNTNNKSNVKVIGNNILQKTDRNGKISLVTNKTKPKSTTMNVEIQKQLGLMHSGPKKALMKQRAPLIRQPPSQTIRQAVLNEIDFARNYDSNMFKWTSKPGGHITASQLISSLDKNRAAAIKNENYQQDWQNSPLINRSRLAPPQYLDIDMMMEDEEMPMVSPIKQTISLQGSTRNSNIHMRLDNNRIEPQTHGILSQATKTKVVVPAGHRIVVSNLQSTVTQDDVKELFEDIGQLLAARLVRPGVAEVIYKNLKDAQKAVDTYHNRQLDGQPMKCLLVNKRPLNNPTAPPITKMETHGILCNEAPISNKLVPDLSTIHKVLFQRK